MENRDDEVGSKRRWKMSRRRFIGAAGAVVAATTFLTTPLGALLAGILIRPDPLITLHASDFAKLVGQSFRVHANALHSVALELAEVQTNLAPTLGGECYSLIFHSRDNRVLTQNTYRIEPSPVGTFSLFIVPGARSADGQNYIAVINHIHV